MMKRKRLTPQLMLGTKDQLDYYPFTDSGGNKLKSNEILFCFEEESEKQIVEIWGEDENEITGYSIFSEGVTWLPANTKKFPIGLITADGKEGWVIRKRTYMVRSNYRFIKEIYNNEYV